MAEKGTYSDPRCYACKPRIDNTLEDKRINAMLDAAAIDAARAMDGYLHPNPSGWREVDGVQLPPITWGELVPSAFPVKAGDTLVFTIAEPSISMETMRANRGVTEPDEWAAKEAQIERYFHYWTDEKKAEARASLGPKPYHSGRLDVLRKGRAE